MTSPITPNPGIHNVPQSTVTNSSALFSPAQIETFALQLFNAFALTVINAILSALGLSQFEGPIDQAILALESALQGIPQDNILGLGNLAGTVSVIELALSTISAAIGNVVDTITNVLGITGANNLISTMESALTSGLSGLLPAVFDNLDGTGSIVSTLITDLADGTAFLESQLGNSPLATLVDSLDGTAMSVAQLVQNFTGGANPIISTAQDLVDTITNVMTGGNSAGNLIADAESALQAIPFVNVLGTLGPANIGSTLETAVDNLWQALTGGTATGNSLGQLANAAASTSSTASNAQMVAQSAALTQAQQATAKAAYVGIDTTVDATFQLAHTYSLASMPTITVSAGTSTVGYIVTPDNVSKLSVPFIAETVGTVTGVYVNIYTVNTSTNLCTNVVAGPNIVSEIGTSIGLVYYNLTSALPVTVGSVFAVEVVVTGSGSLTMMGMSPTWMVTNSLVNPGAVGGSRSGTGTLAAPAHDATGAGTFTGTSKITFSWSHTTGSSANGMIIAFSATQSVSSVKVSGATATLLGSKLISGSETGYLYELLGLSTGAHTVAITLSSAGNLIGNSDSYINVTSFGTVAFNSGSAGTASVSVASASGQTAVAAIFDFGTSNIAGFNQTSRWDNGYNGGPILQGVFGDAAGASTVSFSATATTAWAAIGVSIVGSPAVPSTFTPTASTSIPWLGLSAAGGVINPQFAPQTTEYGTAGTYTYHVPSWAAVAGNKFDIIVLGGGGGGNQSFFGAAELGGAGGSWSTVTLTYGADIPLTTTTFSVTVGASGGAGIENGANPTNGGNSSVTITGYGTITGSGGTAGGTRSQVGASPGNESFDSVQYFGGTPQSSAGGGGNAPGGGGAGATNFGSGGGGAPGAVWIMAYQP